MLTPVTTCIIPGRADRYVRVSPRGDEQYWHRRAYVEAHGPIPEGHEIDQRGTAKCLFGN